jgi:hypothetical protein
MGGAVVPSLREALASVPDPRGEELARIRDFLADSTTLLVKETERLRGGGSR